MLTKLIVNHLQVNFAYMESDLKIKVNWLNAMRSKLPMHLTFVFVNLRKKGRCTSVTKKLV